jgi:cytoplasmic tRNA 2-thiolation protein 1
MPVCKACLLIEGLNKGVPKLGIGKTERYRKEMQKKDQCCSDQSLCHCMKEKLTVNEGD